MKIFTSRFFSKKQVDKKIYLKKLPATNRFCCFAGVVLFALSFNINIAFSQSCTDNNIGFNLDTTSNSLSICAGTAGSTIDGDDPAGTPAYSWEVASSLAGPYSTVSSDVNDDEWVISADYYNVPGTYYFRRVVTGSTSCDGYSDTVTLTVNEIPTLSGASQVAPVCEGSGALINLTGLLVSSTFDISYTINSGAVQTATGVSSDGSGNASFTSIVLSAANNGQILEITSVTITNTTPNCTQTFTTDVTLSVTENPSVANAGADQTGAATCGLTSVTLAANAPAVGTGAWSIVSGAGGSFGDASSPVSVFNGTAGITYTLRWTISNAPCTASTDDVVITFNENPTTADAGPDQTGVATCGLTSVTLAANAPAVGTGAWSIVSGAGGSFVDASSPTSTFNGTAGTTYTLRWTITNSPCTVSTDDVVITFNQAPTAANAGPDQTGAATCGLTTVTLAANTAVTGTGAWSIVSGAGGSFGNAASPTSTFSGTAGTTYTLRWTITLAATICPASSDDVVVTFNRNPSTANAGPDQTGVGTCGLTTVTLGASAVAVGSGSWSVVSGAGGSFGNVLIRNTTFSGTAGAAYTLRWTITSGPCTASTNDVNIIFNIAPAANAGADQDVCTTTTTLAGNIPAAGTGTWTLVSGTGTITTPSSASSGITGLGMGANTFRWTLTNAPCATSFDDVVITRSAAPTTAAAGADQNACGTSTTLAGNTPVTGTGAWSIVSGTGGSFGNAASPTSSFNGITGNAYTLRWTISSGGCTPSTDDVNIVFNVAPTTSNAGADQNTAATCGLTSVTLAANTPVIGTGAWSIVSGAGGSFGNAASPSSTFSGTAGTTYTLRWTITNAPCTSTDDVVVTFNRNPTTATAGSPATICSNASTTLNGNAPTIGTGTWSVTSGPSTSAAQFANVTVRNTTFSPSGGAGTYILTWTISNSPCTASSANVTITVNPAPSVAAIAGASSVCVGSTTTLTDATGGGTWSSSNNGIATVNASGLVTGVSSGTVTITYSVTSGGCTGTATKSVTVNAVPNPTVTFLEGSSLFTYSTSACGIIEFGAQNDMDILSGDPGGSATYQWQVSFDNGANWSNGPGPTATTTQYVLNPVYTTIETVAGTYLFRIIITNNGCSGTSNSITLTITGTSDLTSGTVGSNQSFCANGNPAAFTVLTAPTGGTGSYGYQWQSSTDNVNFTNIAGATSSTYDAPAISVTTYYRRITTSGGCQAITNTITVTVSAAIPAVPGSITGASPVCASSAQTYSITAVPGATSYNWSLPATWSGSSTSISINATAGTSSGNISVTATNGCGTSAASSLAITVTPIPSNANAGADQNNCNNGNFTLAGNTPAVGNGTWSLVSGTASITTPSSPVSGVTGVPAGTSATLRWTISNSPCTAKTDDVILTNKADPTTANAGPDQTGASTCGLTSVTLAANTASVGTGAWSIVSGAGGSFGNAASPTSTFNGTAGTTYTLRWTISNAPCVASTDDVLITFNRNPTTANAGPDQTSAATCGLTTVTLAANTPAVGTGAWTIVSGVGGSFANSASQTSTFTGTAGTSYTLRWTISNAPCTASTDDVVVTFNLPPTASNAGPDQTSAATCGLTSVTLAANTPVTGTGAWSIVSGAGGSFVAASNPTTTFNGTAGTAYTLRWTITNGVCTSTDDVLVTFNRNPTVSNAGADKTNCNSGSFTMTGNTATVGTGAWTLVSGTATITTASSPTSGITGVPAGTSATLRWTISNNPCTASFDDVVLTNVAASTAPNAGADQTQCNNGSFTLAGNTIINGTGSWSVVSGTASITTASSPVSGVTGVPAGTSATLRWTNTNTPCAVLTDDVVLTNNASPVTTGVTICQAGSGSLTSSTSCPSGGTATAGPNNAASGANVNGPGTGGSWTNTGNLNTAGSATVTVGNGGTSEYLQGTNYGFAIPGTAVINGIQVAINRSSSSNGGGNSIDDVTVSLIKSGTITGNNYATATDWPTSLGIANYGGTADLWGTTWTPAQVNANNFGVALSVLNESGGSTRTASVDYIQITITYTLPGTLNWFTVSSGGTSFGSGSPFNPVGVANSGLANTNTPGTTTYYAECSTIPGCRSATSFVINPAATLSAAALSEAVCAGSTAQVNLMGLVASSTSTIAYTINGVAQTPVAGVVANAGGNASFNTAVLSAANNGQTLQITSVTITSASPSCAQSFSNSFALSVKSTGTWLGVNTNWNDPLNWCGGVPTTTTDILVPGSLVNYPLLNTGTGSVKNVTIQNTATVNVSNAKLQISGAISNSGSFNAAAGTIELNGTGSAQAISGAAFVSRMLSGLIISNPAGVNVSAVANDTLNITDSLAFGNVNNAVLNTGNNITLVSRAAKTARVNDITNNGVNSGNSFTGKMIVERFIPQRRSWRMLSVPFIAAGAPTFNASWQEGVVNPDFVFGNRLDPHPGFGMHISGASVALGFDPTPQNNPSIKYYDPKNAVWVGIPNTLSAKITDSAGYMVFVRGDRSTPVYLNTAAPVNNTILRASGQIKTNLQTNTVPAGVGPYTVVGNPYPSSLDLRKISTTGNVSAVNYVMWDPALTGLTGVGAYQYFTRSGGPGTDYLVFPGNSGAGGGSYGAALSVNNTVQSGQAFMVQNAGTGTISINENAKVGSNTSTVFRPASPASGPAANPVMGYISTLFSYEDVDGTAQLVDGALSLYNHDYSDEIDLDDAKKLLNFSSENFGIDRATEWLQIEKRKRADEGDTIQYKMRFVKVRNYQLAVSAANIGQPGLAAFLEDRYLRTLTPLDMNGTIVHHFAINTDSGAWNPARFRIVFKNMVALPVTFSTVKAYKNNSDINVEWNVEHESAILNYEVEKSADGVNFSKVYTETNVLNSDRSIAYRWVDKAPIKGLNFYRIRSKGADGSFKISAIVKVAFDKLAAYITLYPNPVTEGNLNLYFVNQPAGAYNIRLLGNNGQLIAAKKINHSEAALSEPFTMENELPHGTYLLEIFKPDGTKQTINVMY